MQLTFVNTGCKVSNVPFGPVMKLEPALGIPVPRRRSSPLERRRRTPLYPDAPDQPVAPFSKRESDLAKARIKKWLELADTTLQKDEDHQGTEGNRAKRKKSA